MNTSILFDVLATGNDMQVGVATLNSPETLNGLSLSMCSQLAARLAQWEKDDSIAFVVLKGAGEKAFCAGGDLQGLYRSMLENPSGQAWNNTYARDFFAVEYELDYTIHTYSKPVLCWGTGIVMGGGVGLMMGASHRVVSETTRLAMPEMSIGLFPDVGGTWMLARLRGGVGLFLALTGAQLGAADIRFLGLADYSLETARWPVLMRHIQEQAWSGSRADNDVRLRRLLLSLRPTGDFPGGPLQKNYALIANMCDGPDLEAICAGVTRLASHEDSWLKRGAAVFRAGAPGSARLCFTLLRKARLLSLAEAFQQEYIVSLQCSVQGDFQEGIRALLIDKDKRPRWNPATLDEASHLWVQRFFVPAWPDSVTHPLARLADRADYHHYRNREAK